jgi:rsbT co-antagonist protein RsbR
VEIADLQRRLERAARALAEIGAGNWAQEAEIEVGRDALGALEQGINNVMMDLQTLELANREKEASLELQQAALVERLATIEAQRQQLEVQERDLRARLETIHYQAEAIRELSTPILEIEEQVIALPIVGVVDTKRAHEITEKLLEHIGKTHSRCVILDVTGVQVVDTATAGHLIKVVRAAALMGARCVVTGLSPAVAQTLVAVGVELGGTRTLRNLREGLRDSLAFLRSGQA